MGASYQPGPKVSIARPSARLDFVDTYRGIAVVLMILWHTTDNWLAEPWRSGSVWELLRLLGGMAAPSFLFLAGASVALKAIADERRAVPAGESIRGMVARGLEIVVLGYMLRFQMWIVDGLGFRASGSWRVIVPFVVAYVLLLVGLRPLGKHPVRALAWLAPGVAAFALGVYQATIVVPHTWVSLLRVDVLQAIGASLVIGAAVGAPLGALGKRPWLALAIGIGIALCTDFVASAMPGPLPLPLAGYLAKITPPPGARPPSLFPLLPWTGYAFCGAAVGGIWARASRAHRVTEAVVWLAVVGALVAIATKEMAPWNDELLVAAQWLLPAFRMLYRVGLDLVIGAVALGIVALAGSGRSFTPLRWLGQTSLLVYWVHLEPSFGIVATPLKRALGLAQWGLGFAALTLAMVGVSWVRLGPFQRGWNRLSMRLQRSARHP